jgi:alcohol dehydrogenase class IV
LGLADKLLSGLTERGIRFFIYDKTVANPTVDNIEEALAVYRANNCSGIIAFGGGSPLDCAKGVGARVARPDKSISRLRGVFRVGKSTPPLFAVPTTAGTGSEATLAAVITDGATHEKYAVSDTRLIPRFAVLDPELTLNLPKNLTAATGMDALTHAVEAYIGGSNTKETRKAAREAVKLIFTNLPVAYSDGQNIDARKNMQLAAYYAGVAFTRAYVGYAHAIAHTLGGLYSVPHGLANAVLLPYVLEYYGKSVCKRLAELSVLAGAALPTDDNKTKALRFIRAIKELNAAMNIPDKLSVIREADVGLAAARACREANPLYPVPRILNKRDIEALLNAVRA